MSKKATYPPCPSCGIEKKPFTNGYCTSCRAAYQKAYRMFCSGETEPVPKKFGRPAIPMTKECQAFLDTMYKKAGK